MPDWTRLEGVDWRREFDAYGLALEAEPSLRGLISGEPRAQDIALGYVNDAALHQQTVYSVTPIVVGAVVAMLGDPALRTTLPDGRSTLKVTLDILELAAFAAEMVAIDEPPDLEADRDDIERFLADLAVDPEGANWFSDGCQTLMANGIYELRALAPVVVAALAPLVGDSDPEVSVAAWCASRAWSELPAAGRPD